MIDCKIFRPFSNNHIYDFVSVFLIFACLYNKQVGVMSNRLYRRNKV